MPRKCCHVRVKTIYPYLRGFFHHQFFYFHIQVLWNSRGDGNTAWDEGQGCRVWEHRVCPWGKLPLSCLWVRTGRRLHCKRMARGGNPFTSRADCSQQQSATKKKKKVGGLCCLLHGCGSFKLRVGIPHAALLLGPSASATARPSLGRGRRVWASVFCG